MPNAPKNLSSELKTRKRDKLQGSQKMYQLQKLESEYKEQDKRNLRETNFQRSEIFTRVQILLIHVQILNSVRTSGEIRKSQHEKNK